MPSHQLGKNPKTQVMLSVLRCRYIPRAGLQHLPPRRVCFGRMIALCPAGEVSAPRQREGQEVSPLRATPRCPGPPGAQAAAGWLTPAGPRADKRPIFSPPK